MNLLERRLRGLLRWYPRSWRARHEEVMFATLLEDAEARGLERPARMDAWSIRVHGVAERLTLRAAAILAGIALAAYLVPELAWRFWTGDPFSSLSDPPLVRLAAEPGRVVAVFVGLAVAGPAVSVAVLALVRRLLRLPAGACCSAMASLVVAGLVLGLDGVRSIAFPTLIDISDTQQSLSSGAPAEGAWAIAALVLIVGLLPCCVVAVARVTAVQWLQWPLAALASIVVSALVLGVAGTTFGGVVVVVLLVLVPVLERGRREDAVGIRRPWSPWLVGGLSAVALGLSVPIAVLLVADAFVDVRGEGLRWAAAAVTAGTIAIVLALALVLRQRIGHLIWMPAGALVVASVASSVVAAIDPGVPVVSTVSMIATVCTGVGVGLTLLVMTSGSLAWRLPVSAAVGTGSAVLLAGLLPFALTGLWFAAVPLLVTAIVHGRRAARRSETPEDDERLGLAASCG